MSKAARRGTVRQGAPTVNGNDRGGPPPRGLRARRCRPIRSQEGFTYVGILLAIALVGTQLAVAGLVWSFAQERQKERELLFVGEQFRTAIARYYLNPQGPQKEYPRRLEDLVGDPRYPGTVRHLRKIYADPITGKVQWGLITTPDGSILGVHSLAEKAPIKIGNFRPTEKSFEKQQRYADWKFVYMVGMPVGLSTGSPASASSSPNAGGPSSDVQIYSIEGQGETAAPSSGAGIGFVAAYNLRHWRGVVPLLPMLQIPPLPCWLAVHREIRGNALVRKVYDFLAQELPGELVPLQ